MDQTFTLEDANEICEDFEDLRDTEFFYNGEMVLVEDVVVSDAQGMPAGSGYDVTIVASGAAPGNTQYNISIRDYIALKGVSYNFPSEY